MNRSLLLSLLALGLLFVTGCDPEVEVEGDEAGECDDGVDNDQDGNTDCEDDGCAAASACTGDDDDTAGDDDDVSDDDDSSVGDDDDSSVGDDDDSSVGDDDDDSSADGDSDGDGVPDSADVCPGVDDATWTPMDDEARCVQVFEDTAVDWDGAEAACNGVGGNLVRISSAADTTQLVSLSNALPGEHIWIGFNDQAAEGSWEWTDGGPTGYQNWRSGEPSGGGGENCGTMYHYPSYTGEWNDLSCTGNGLGGGYACQVGT